MAELGRARPIILAAIATILTANIAIISADWTNAQRALAVTATANTTQAAGPSPYVVLFGKADAAFVTPTVFSVRADGTGLTPSSHPPTRTDIVPGHRAVIDGSGAIAFSNRSGVVVRILPPPPGNKFDAFAWSPDGQQLAVVRSPLPSSAGTPGLFVTSVLGEPVHMVAAGIFRAVDWSHDGTRLAAVRADAGGDDLWVFTVQGREATQVTHDAPARVTVCGHTANVKTRVQQPMWSPDDEHIAFLSNDDVAVGWADGSRVVTVDQAPPATCDGPAEYLSLFGWEKRANMAA